MRRPLLHLREQLMRAGVAPGWAARFARELDDHCTDLAEALAAAGLTGPEAEAEALRRLGPQATLVAAMAAQPRLRGWASRAPVPVFLCLPPLLFLAFAALAAAGLVALAPVQGALAAAAPLVPALPAVLAPLAIGLGTALVARRQRCALPLPLLGLMPVALGAAATRLELVATGAGRSVGLALAMPGFAGLIAALAAATMPLLLAEALARRAVRSC